MMKCTVLHSLPGGYLACLLHSDNRFDLFGDLSFRNKFHPADYPWMSTRRHFEQSLYAEIWSSKRSKPNL